MPVCDKHASIMGASVDDSFRCPICEIGKLHVELTKLRSSIEADKLFLVECRGMKSGISGAPSGVAYVLAVDSGEAYNKLRSYLDRDNLGFLRDRALDKVTLIAEIGEVVECGMRLIR